ASARIADNRMILADTDHRRDEVLAFSRKAAGRLEALLALGKSDSHSELAAVQIFGDIALAHKNLHLYDDAIRFTRRSMEIARTRPDVRAHGWSVIADSMRLSGDLEGALQAIREARGSLQTLRAFSQTSARTYLFNILWREGTILG